MTECDDMTEFQKWCGEITSSGRERLTNDQLVEAWRETNKHGPPNCWTGTTGGMARLARLLLVEIVQRNFLGE